MDQSEWEKSHALAIGPHSDEGGQGGRWGRPESLGWGVNRFHNVCGICSSSDCPWPQTGFHICYFLFFLSPSPLPIEWGISFWKLLSTICHGVKADVYTWLWIHQGEIAEWSPLADVAHSWVLRFTQSFQCLHLQWRFHNSFKSPSRMGWGALIRTRSNPIQAPNHVISGFVQPISHNESRFSPTFKFNNLIYGNYLSYMHGCFLW